MILELIPFILGFFVVFSGIFKLQKAVDFARIKYNKWTAILIIAIINIAFGILLILNPFTAAMVLFRFIGIGLFFSSATDLYTILYFSKCANKYIEDKTLHDYS